MDLKNLNDKQKAFAKEYLIDYNGTRAYREIYPDCEYDSARAASSKLLTNINIKNYIEHIQKDLLKLCGVSVLGNVMKLKEIIEDDLTDKPSDKIKALEVINKMLGLNAPDKSETKVEGNITNEPTKITFSKKS
tara:strand:- start:118 stop:519 length:402 start_codon:yes stop_codon:yes gene_type:complete